MVAKIQSPYIEVDISYESNDRSLTVGQGRGVFAPKLV